MTNDKAVKKTPLEIAQEKLRKNQANELKLKKAQEKQEKRKQELQAANEKTKALKKKIARSDSKIDIIKKLAKIKTEPSRQRSHEATTGFFNILDRFNNSKNENDFSNNYNFIHDTKKVREAVEAAITYDKDKDTLIISGSVLREKINEQKHAIDEILKAAAVQLGLNWEKVLNGEDTIPTNLVKNETENTSA